MIALRTLTSTELALYRSIAEELDQGSAITAALEHETHRRGPTLVGGCSLCVAAARETLRAVERATLCLDDASAMGDLVGAGHLEC